MPTFNLKGKMPRFRINYIEKRDEFRMQRNKMNSERLDEFRETRRIERNYIFSEESDACT